MPLAFPGLKSMQGSLMQSSYAKENHCINVVKKPRFQIWKTEILIALTPARKNHSGASPCEIKMRKNFNDYSQSLQVKMSLNMSNNLPLLLRSYHCIRK